MFQINITLLMKSLGKKAHYKAILTLSSKHVYFGMKFKGTGLKSLCEVPFICYPQFKHTVAAFRLRVERLRVFQCFDCLHVSKCLRSQGSKLKKISSRHLVTNWLKVVANCKFLVARF